MASPYRSQFLEAANVEIQALVEHGTWIEDLMRHATTRMVPSQWVFTIKRTADGEIKKFKARLALRGDLQECEGETFSPVAAWTTVRFFLIVSMALQWATLTIDFSNAFEVKVAKKAQIISEIYDYICQFNKGEAEEFVEKAFKYYESGKPRPVTEGKRVSSR